MFSRKLVAQFVATLIVAANSAQAALNGGNSKVNWDVKTPLKAGESREVQVVAYGDKRERITEGGDIFYLEVNSDKGTQEFVKLKDNRNGTYSGNMKAPENASKVWATVHAFESGLNMEYYTNKEFKGEPARRDVSATIDKDWGDGTVGPLQQRDNVGVKFNGFFQPYKKGQINFYVDADDATTVVFNGKEAAKFGYPGGPFDYKFDTTDLQFFDLFFIEHGGAAKIKLFWQDATGNFVIVPNNAYYRHVGETASKVEIAVQRAGSKPDEPKKDPRIRYSEPEVEGKKSKVAVERRPMGVGDSREIYVQAVDELGKQRRTGGDVFYMIVKGKDRVNYTRMQDNRDGTYQATIPPQPEGEIYVTVSAFAPGLHTEWYNSNDFKGKAQTSLTKQLNYKWGGEKVGPTGRADNVSARFTGFIEPYRTGDIAFNMDSDDVSTFWFDGKKVAEFGYPGGNFRYNFKSDDPIEFRLDWKEFSGGATANLAWQEPSGQFKVVPEDAFYHSANDVISNLAIQVCHGCSTESNVTIDTLLALIDGAQVGLAATLAATTTALLAALI